MAWRASSKSNSVPACLGPAFGCCWRFMSVSSPTAVPVPGDGPPVAARRFPGRLFCFLLAASLAMQALIYGVITAKPVIRSDGVGYYLYLPAALIHGDLTLESVVRQ